MSADTALAQTPVADNRRGSAALATEMSIRRLVLVIVPLWVLSLILNVLSHPSETSGLLLGACFTLVLAGYAGYAWANARVALLAAVVGTALAIALGDPVASLAVFPLVVPWLNMATTVVGALVPGRAGLLGVLGVSALGSAAVAVTSGPTVAEVGGILSQALAGGLCMWVGVSAFRDAARETDRAAEDLVATQTRTAWQAARITEFRSIARALHDTAINTLGVLRLPGYDPHALRERCREDLLLGAGAAAHGDMAAVTTGWSTRAKVLGLDAQIALHGSAAVPPAIREALAWAVMEAMQNCAKHSGQRTVLISGTWDAGGGVIEVADRGRGFGRARLTGGGAQSILSRCTEAGITVEHFDRDGAVVRFQWTVSEAPTATPVDTSDSAQLLSRAAVRIAAVLLAFGVYSTPFSPQLLGRLGGAMTIALLTLVIGWAAMAGRGRITQTPPVALAMLAVAAVTILPGMGDQGCERIAWHWWGSLAGLAVLVCIVLVDGRRSAILASVVTYTMTFASILLTTEGLTDSCSGEGWSILLLVLGIIIGVVALRRVLVKQTAAAARDRRANAELAVANAQLQARERVRQHMLLSVSALYVPILQGIADGSLDPADEQVRLRAANAETALRAVHSLPPELGPLSERLADLIVEHADSVHPVLSVDPEVRASSAQSEAFMAVCRRWFSSLPSGAQARISFVSTVAGATILLTGPTPESIDLPTGWQRLDAGDETLLETTWSSATAPSPGSAPTTGLNQPA